MKRIIASMLLLSCSFFMASERRSHFPSTSSDESTSSEHQKSSDGLRRRKKNSPIKIIDSTEDKKLSDHEDATFITPGVYNKGNSQDKTYTECCKECLPVFCFLGFLIIMDHTAPYNATTEITQQPMH